MPGRKVWDLLGGGVGHRVGTFGDFVQDWNIALEDHKQVHVLNVLLDPRDRSTAMKRVARRLAKCMARQKPGLFFDSEPCLIIPACLNPFKFHSPNIH